MRLINIAIIVGLILFYFVNAALKVDIFNLEMAIHSGIRFLTGFIVIGVGYFYEHKLPLKIAVYIVLGLVLGDDILDYYRGATRFSVELILHGAFMLCWGSVLGYLAIRQIKAKNINGG